MKQKIYLYTPRLKIARLFAASLVLGRAEEIELLVLPYPREIKMELEKFTRSIISWKYLQKRIIELMGSYGYSWLDIEEPLFLGLKLIRERNPKLDLYLYRSIGDEDEKYRITSDLLALALKYRVTGKIEVEEWRRVLSGYRRKRVEVGDKRAIIIIEDKLQAPSGSILIEALPGYIESPLDKLFSSPVSEQIIKEYIEYVTEYLAKYSSIDYAYFKWLKDKGFQGLIVQLSDYFLNLLSAIGED